MENSSRHAPTVYVVDDDEAMRRALSLLLSTVGYQTSAFANPPEFLAQFEPYAVGMSGPGHSHAGHERIGTAAASEPTGSMVPVIFITGHGDVPMAVEAMKEGAFEFIQKPFRDQDLLDRIKHALEQDAENRRTRSARRAKSSAGWNP